MSMEENLSEPSVQVSDSSLTIRKKTIRTAEEQGHLATEVLHTVQVHLKKKHFSRKIDLMSLVKHSF